MIKIFKAANQTLLIIIFLFNILVNSTTQAKEIKNSMTNETALNENPIYLDYHHQVMFALIFKIFSVENYKLIPEFVGLREDQIIIKLRADIEASLKKKAQTIQVQSYNEFIKHQKELSELSQVDLAELSYSDLVQMILNRNY